MRHANISYVGNCAHMPCLIDSMKGTRNDMQTNACVSGFRWDVHNNDLLFWWSRRTLSFNQLSGTIPRSIGNLNNLTVLWVGAQGRRRLLLLLLCVDHGCEPRVHANSKENTFVRQGKISYVGNCAHMPCLITVEKHTQKCACMCLGTDTTMTCCFGCLAGSSTTTNWAERFNAQSEI